MRDPSFHHGVRAREAETLTFELELRENEMRGRRPDVDPDGPQAQALGRDLAPMSIGIVAVMSM
jgi:hypothetical protein